MSRSWAKGSSYGWRKVRAGVLARDGYLCQLQIPDTCTGRATCVHHTRGRALTGDDPSFLVSSCRECNLKVGDPTKKSNDPKARPITEW